MFFQMPPPQPIRCQLALPKLLVPVAMLLVASLVITTAATVDKAANADALNLGSSWLGGVPPTSADIAQWSATVTGANTVSLGANTNWGGLKILSPGGAVTINAGNALTLGAGGVDMSLATMGLALNCALTLGTNQSWNIASGQTLAVAGAVGGTAVTLTKSGSGTALLSGLNTFSGNVAVSAGKLTLSHQRALGFASATVANGAQISIGTATTYTNALTLTGDGDQGALRFNGGAAAWSGPITLAGGARIGGYAGSGAYTLSGGIGGSGDLELWAGGAAATHVHTFTISAPCSYTGDTLLNTYAACPVVVLAGAANRLPTNSVLTMLAGVWNNQVLTATLKLNGNNQSFAGLASGSGVFGSGGTNRVVNGSATAATLTISTETDRFFDGFLGGPAANENNFGLTKNVAGRLTVNRASTYTGATLVNGGALALNGGLGGGAATVANGAALLLGNGAFTLGSLTLRSNATLGVNLGATNNPRNTVIQVNGNLTLAGTVLVQNLGGAAAGSAYTIINYTGTLTNLGMTTDPRSPWDVAVDASVPGQVRLRLLQLHPLAEFTNGAFAVSTTSTNLGGLLRGFPALPLWYEVRDATNRLWDFGAATAVSPWSITVRHLRPGTNTVTVFARDADGNTTSNSVQLTMTLGTNPLVRPRPRPAEIWWGGSCHDNLTNAGGSIIGTYSRLTQLTNTSGWDFVKRYQDGFLLHGYVWVNAASRMTNAATVGAAIGAQLAPFNGRFWLEDGWRPRASDPNYGHSSAPGQAAHAAEMLALGMPLSEITQDFNPLWREFCTNYLGWATNDIRALITGYTNGTSAAYPYHSGQWRDFATDFNALRPDVKQGWTWSPVWFHWLTGPSLGTDNGVFSISLGGTNRAFNWDFYDFMRDAALIGGELGLPFAFASDCPWDYFGEYPGNPGGWSAAWQAQNRKKIRDYEAWLAVRDLRHTLICNSSDNGSAGNPDAYDRAYKTNSLRSIYLHQQEGGRAGRYLFESWYQGPFAILPEAKAGSYANLTLDAIKFLKGIADTNGALEPLALTVLGTGATTTLQLKNNGDVPCLPALAAVESGAAGTALRYYNAAGAEITSAILSAEGFAYTNLLQPGQATTFTIVVQGKPVALSKTVVLEAFWNPQDPTGIVRDRQTLVLPPAQGAFGGTPAAVPGTIQVENFDVGGEGIATHDTTVTNLGGQFRTNEAVDIEVCSDAGGGYDIGWAVAGEWLAYTVNVASNGYYTLEARVSSSGTVGTFHVEMDGTNLTGTLTVPNTGGWQTWQTVSKANLLLGAGSRVLRLVLDANGTTGYVGNFNWLRFTAIAPPQFSAITSLPAGGVRLDGTGPTNQAYRLFTAADLRQPLASWTLAATGTFASGVFQFQDTPATNTLPRFYRIVSP